MTFTLVPAAAADKKIIENLMQFYTYDFSEYIDLDVQADGLFGAYDQLEAYWNGVNSRFPYIIKKDEKYAGFVLVRFIESEKRNYFSIAEFFVMKKYRLLGIGKAVATEVFNLHRGEWEVYQKETNKPAQLFWKKTIQEYTNGKFTERKGDGRLIQDFENRQQS